MELWPYRLAVRTPGSHPGNPGSIPGGVTRSVIHNLAESPSFCLLENIMHFCVIKMVKTGLLLWLICIIIHLLDNLDKVTWRNVSLD